MIQTPKATLCGGTFLSILLKNSVKRVSSREKLDGIKDPFSHYMIFNSLISIYAPGYEFPIGSEQAVQNAKTQTSTYKNCKTNCSFFNDLTLINNFTNNIAENYNRYLLKVKDLVSSYIDYTNKAKNLVCELYELINNDDSIHSNFLIDDSKYIEKKDLLQMSEVSLDKLILGIWFYIISNKIDNTIGRDEITHLDSIINQSNFSNITVCSMQFEDKPSLAIQIEQKNTTNDVQEESKATSIIVEEDKDYKKYHNYFKYLYDNYNHIKTLLYKFDPKPFYDFYVCNSLYKRVPTGKNSYTYEIINNVTVKSLHDISRYIILSGTGGLGKSMMMRHLLLDSISNYSTNKLIPILITLKDYENHSQEIIDYVYSKLNHPVCPISREDYLTLLVQGKFLLLFDGLDEISSKSRSNFERGLDQFSQNYPANMFIISTRPVGFFISLSKFNTLQLRPFSLIQSNELVNKLEFRPDEPMIKENFIKELNSTLHRTHWEFIQNPLLLTIMLMTFEQYNEVPSKMHIFYHEAFITLAQTHDASKGMSREFKTKLSTIAFSDYFAEFCAKTYREEKYDFTDDEFDRFFTKLKDYQNKTIKFDSSQFKYDLVNNLCIMYYESGKYHFTHRSFQEYFCALFFSKQKDRTLHLVGDLFDKQSTFRSGDTTFSMLYDMITTKVEEYIFMPFIESLFEYCEANNRYKTFLEKYYPKINYDNGDVDDYTINRSSSFLLEFITKLLKLDAYLASDFDDFPKLDEFVDSEYANIDENWDDPDKDENIILVRYDEIDYEYKSKMGDPEIVGWSLSFNPKTIFKNPEEYEGVYDILMNENFILHRQYEKLKVYLFELKQKQIPIGEDIFDYMD